LNADLKTETEKKELWSLKRLQCVVCLVEVIHLPKSLLGKFLAISSDLQEDGILTTAYLVKELESVWMPAKGE
jgi:hypothetical protein